MSVWIDHFRKADAQLANTLGQGLVMTHPFVVGEIACASLRHRPVILELLQDLPAAVVAEHDEALGFLARHRLHGRGIGHVDVHLLAAVALTTGSLLRTRDGRWHAVAHDSASPTRTKAFVERLTAGWSGRRHRLCRPDAHP